MTTSSFPLMYRVGSPLCVLIATVVLSLLPARIQAAGEQTFGSPADAINALTTAAKNQDKDALQVIFGPEGHELVSADAVQATEGFKEFVQRLTQKTQMVTVSDAKITLNLGADGWPFPIPLVKQNGLWFFDAAAGKTEILNRRVGMDELGAIAVCHAYCEAQREYASQDRMGDGVMAYAKFLRSTPGTHDGLFWPARPNEELSPLGPLVAAAHGEGYHRSAKMMNDQAAPYHGYYFKILTSQGKHAPGEDYDYLIHGRMIAGFALIAWPAVWSNTGVMTFIVNQQGKVYECNLGPDTVKIAAAITQFDPDNQWKALP